MFARHRFPLLLLINVCFPDGRENTDPQTGKGPAAPERALERQVDAMLFSDITDCEMVVFRCIQEAGKEISLVEIMEELEKKYGKDWKRSTVCTFISHLISKGYVSGRREGRVFFYSSAVNDKKFREEQARQFLDFWFHGSISEFAEAAFRAKKVSKKEAAEVLASIDKLETR